MLAVGVFLSAIVWDLRSVKGVHRITKQKRIACRVRIFIRDYAPD